jgi:ubiquinone/menaquinone biosynthesis C-methylase UbiE
VPRLGEIYSRTAAFYDSVVADKQAKAKLTAIDLLQRRPDEQFLEVGVGTGWMFGRIVAASGARNSYGLDVAEGMLEVARGVLAEEASLILGDARALPFPDAAIDCVLNTYTFEVLPVGDIPPVLDETLRVLKPGGRAVIVNLTDATDGGSEDEAMISDWKQRYEMDPEFFGGARPLQLSEMLIARGFSNVSRRYIGPEWPSEVLLAYR